MRTFVSIDGPDDPWLAGAPAATRAPTHLTVRFLGDVDDSRIPSVATALRDVAPKFRAFPLTFEGVGAFPSSSSPRVVWVGVSDGRAELVELAGAVGTTLEGIGFPRDPAPFVPHLTLFRVRSPTDRRRARRLLDGEDPAPDPRKIRVGEFLLKESTLGATGAAHRTIERFPLAEAVP